MEMTFNILNLDCAHCAGKIEEALNKMDGIDSAVLIFASKKLKVKGNLTPDKIEEMNKLAQKIEAGVEFVSEIGDVRKNDENSLKKEIITLIIGVIVFLSAALIGKITDSAIITIILHAAAYLILGHKILIATFRNISKGNFFDENLLMTVATVGAFILGEFSEAVGVVLFFKIGEIFENYAVNKSRKAITAAADLKVNEADILIDGKFIQMSADKIQPGTLIRVKPGERIAADGVVESGESRLDTSAVNGEPVPLSVKPGDNVISGCINLHEVITVKATASAGDSLVSEIADAVENAAASKPEIDRFITRFARIYTPFVLAAAAATAIIPSLITGEWSKWLYTALTFLVISCPCALVLSVPLAYFSGIGAASKLGILFKGGNALEALGNVKAVVFDKTGTVTNGTFNVTGVYPYNGLTEEELLSVCGSCEAASTHPAALSIIRHCTENGIKYEKADRLREISGRGISAVISGKNVLCGNERLMTENGIIIPEDNEKTAGTVVYTACDGKCLGKIIISDTIRKKSAEAVSQLKSMRLYTAMLTGDKEENAQIIGKHIGIDYSKGGLLPSDKLSEIEKIRDAHGAVMFVGDGINDGPVLAGADVGAAMCSGSDLALEAADAVFMNQELDSAVKAIRIAGKTKHISCQNIIFALFFKAAVLILGMLGYASMWFAVFADSGVAMLLILNSLRVLRTRK